MAAFEVEVNGKTYVVEAADQGSALAAIKSLPGLEKASGFARDASMGADGVSGDSIRASNAGNTRWQMRPQDIAAAYDVAQQRGDKPEQRAMAQAYVQRERADSPITMGVGDRLRSAARGVPYVGEWLDEANAATLHPFDKQAREKALDYERARDTSFDAASPYQSMAGKGIGGLAGSIAAAPAAAATGTSLLLGGGATSLPGAVWRGIAAGGVQGATAGAGRAETARDMPMMAAKDGAIGSAFGGAASSALGGAKILADAIRAKAAPRDALSSIPTKAADYITQKLGNKDAVNQLSDRMNAIGPHAMLADASPEFSAMAQAGAGRPGARETIINALTARDAGKNARLAQAADESLGRVVEPSAIKAGIQEGKDAVGPMYGRAIDESGAAVQSKALADSLDAAAVDLRGPAQVAVKKARDMLNIPGTTELDPNPNALFQTRQAIDGLMQNEANPKVLQALGDIRQRVDGLLAKAVPGIKVLDAQYQELSRQGAGLDKGATAFRSGPTASRPVDFAADMQQSPNPMGTLVGPSAVPLRIRQGARAELDRVMGTQSNDVAATRNLLKGDGDWNRLKMETLFGPDRAQKFMGALDNETTMENTFRQVVGNSNTGVREGYNRFLDEVGKGVKVPTDMTMIGALLKGGKAAVEKIVGGSSEAKAASVEKALGELSVSNGPQARAIIDALMKRGAKASSDAAYNDFFGRVGAGAGRLDDSNIAKMAILSALMAKERIKGRDANDSRAK